jgi:hypothetical protein
MEKKEKKFLLLISPFELLAGFAFFFVRHKIKREKNNLVAEYVSVYVNDWLTDSGWDQGKNRLVDDGIEQQLSKTWTLSLSLVLLLLIYMLL